MRRLLALLVFLACGAMAGSARSEDCADGFCFIPASDGMRYEDLYSSFFSPDMITVAIIGDGYTSADMGAFEDAAREIVDEFWEYEPFKSHPCAIRFAMVRLLSNDSGIKIPGDATYGNQDTALHTSFSSTTKMGINADSLTCWKAVTAAAVPDPDLICVIVNDPTEHDGAWAYPGWGLLLMSGSWPWGVILAHELGHLIADLGDEYPCWECKREGNYLASADWSREYHAGADEPIDQPNLTTNLDDIPWQSSIWADEVPTRDIPTSNLNAFAGYTIGAWEGGGYFRKGVWRSEEYCIMDGWAARHYEYFCQVCRAAIASNLSDCFYVAPNDCMMVKSKGIFLEPDARRFDYLTAGPLRDLFETPQSAHHRHIFDIPPFWKIEAILGRLPEPIPLVDIPVRLVLRGLPDGSAVAVWEVGGGLVAQGRASGRSFQLEFNASTLVAYRLIVDAPKYERASTIQIELFVNGIAVDLP
jgi:hypothetical protein